MPKYAADHTKPLLKDLERATTIPEKARIPDSLLKANLVHTIVDRERTKIPDSLLKANLVHTIADRERTKILDSLLKANLVHTIADRERTKIPDSLLKANLARTIADRERTKIPDSLLKANLVHTIADRERTKIPDSLLKANLARATPTFKEAKEHRANHVDTDYNHDLAHQSTEVPNPTIVDDNKVITSASSNQNQITEAPTSLREEVKASQDITSERQIKIPRQLESPSEQVKLAPPKRKVGRIKSILTTLFTVLGAGGGSAEIWSQWGDDIKNFFGFLAEIWSQWGDTIKNFFGIHE